MNINHTCNTCAQRPHEGHQSRVSNRTLHLAPIRPFHTFAAINLVFLAVWFAWLPAPAQSTDCVQCPSGLVAWWPGDGSATNLAGSGDGAMRNGATFAAGRVGRAFSFDGVDDFVQVDHHPVLNPSDAITVLAWIKPAAHVGRYDPIVRKSSGANGYALEFYDDLAVFWVHVGSWHSSYGAPVPLQSYSHVAGVFDGSKVSLFVNGRLIGSGIPASGRMTPASGSLNIGRDPSNPDRFFRGQIDEVAIFARALSAAEISGIYAAGTNGICPSALPPTILTWPGDHYASPGADISWSVAASGSEPLTYQWLFNGVQVPDASQQSLTLHQLTTANNGTHGIVVSNTYGVATSPIALLTVDPPNVSGRAPAPTLWRHGQDAALAKAELVYADMQVEVTAAGSYFCAIGGDGYYMGLIDGGTRRHVHFSVWDPTSGFVWKAPDVEAQRFGNEGTGWKTHWFLPWQTNVVYQLCVRFVHEASSTVYAAYFRDPLTNSWKHIASIARPIPNATTGYFYSFDEDFAGTCWVPRSYLVGNEWTYTTLGQWINLSNAMLSVAHNQCRTNAFDADVQDCWFLLETGGDTFRDTLPGTVLTRNTCGEIPSLPEWDTDEDGLPDSWEQAHFGGPLRAEPQADADGDGLTNLQELLAGTRPTDPLSALRILAGERQAAGLKVSWTCAGGKTYALQTNNTPAAAGFADCSPPIAVSGSGESTTNYTHTIEPGSEAFFYRVRLVPSP